MEVHPQLVLFNEKGGRVVAECPILYERNNGTSQNYTINLILMLMTGYIHEIEPKTTVKENKIKNNFCS